METSINLFSEIKGELNKFLSSFFNKDMKIIDNLSWQKKYKNPVEMTELIGVFVDNHLDYSINFWVCLDNNVYIKVSEQNANALIKYIFERYPA